MYAFLICEFFAVDVKPKTSYNVGDELEQNIGLFHGQSHAITAERLKNSNEHIMKSLFIPTQK